MGISVVLYGSLTLYSGSEFALEFVDMLKL